MKKFCEYLKDKRTEANLTQEQVADSMGVSLNAVQNWESGRTRIKKSRLTELAGVLNIDPVELENAFNDDGEDFSNFPFFMYTDEQNEIISQLRLTPEQKEFMMLIRIYNSNNWDRLRNKSLEWHSDIMGALRKIPYKYTEEKGVYKVYDFGQHLSKFLRYVPASFCFDMIRNSPDTVFDIRTLDKKDIFKWMNLLTFGESNYLIPYDYNRQKPSYYSYQVRFVRDFQEKTVKLNEWDYRNRKQDLSYNQNSSKPKILLTEEIYNDADYSITTKLSQAGILFKEWCSDLT